MVSQKDQPTLAGVSLTTQFEHGPVYMVPWRTGGHLVDRWFLKTTEFRRRTGTEPEVGPAHREANGGVVRALVGNGVR
jgi:hypothetical protein